MTHHDFLLEAAEKYPEIRPYAPTQVSPKSFTGTGYIVFHRHRDGLPVAIAKASACVRVPCGTYAAPLPLGDVSLYRCTLPEIHA